MQRKLLIAALSIVAVFGIAGAAFTVVAAGSPSAAGDQAAPGVSQEISTQLRAFRSSSPATIPATIAERFQDGLSTGTEVNVALARKADTDAGAFYIVPGRGTVCQIGGGTMACGDSAALSTEPLGYQLFSHTADIPRNSIVVSGIAADNVTAIYAVQPDGTRIDVHISNNGYATVIPNSTDHIEMDTTDQGVLTTTVPAPLAGPTN